MYEVEYNDSNTASFAANLIAENLFTQVYQAGNRFTILDSITRTRKDGTQVLHQDAFMHTPNKSEHNKSMAYLYTLERRQHHLEHTEESKDSYPVQMDEFAVENCISEELVFVLWVKYMLKKRDRIISKTQRF